ncbi:MAG: hypothetical protein D6801_09645 [Alphaproteobacteria bacterium]|nr:MAG: hypothetical protein D6801_09645 [Alphaproteobacteria bacterium]
MTVSVWLVLVAMLMVSTLRTVSPKALRVPPGGVVAVFSLTVLGVGLALTRPWALIVVFDLAYLGYLAVLVLRARGRLFGAPEG